MSQHEQTPILDFSPDELIFGPFVPIPGLEDFTYEQLFERYASSAYGEAHADSRPRFYERYGYNPANMLEDLGKDVDPVEHMRHTHGVAAAFLQHQQDKAASLTWLPSYTPRDIVTTRLAAYFHDMGEGPHEDYLEIVDGSVGDIAFGNKNIEDENNEAAIRQYVFTKLYPDLPADIIESLQAIILDTDQTLVAEGFNIIERCGYYQTAMRAGRLALKGIEGSASERLARDPESLLQLAKLAVKVSDNHRRVLAEATKFPYGEKVLRDNENTYAKIRYVILPWLSERTLSAT